MTSEDARIIGINGKVEWAKKHINNLRTETDRFLQSNPYKVDCKIDSETNRPVYYIDSIDPIPLKITLIAGDAIHNLRSTLDYLAFQIVRSDVGGEPPNPHNIYFPIFDSEADKSRIRHKLPGAKRETIDAICSLKPYKGGNNLLWTLNRLNNIEKHRNLLTVGSKASGFNMSQMAARHMAGMDSSLARKGAELHRSMGVFIKPAQDRFPLVPGFKLLAGLSGDICDPDQEFKFDIAINEPGIVRRESILDLLTEFTELVENIVRALAPRLKGEG